LANVANSVSGFYKDHGPAMSEHSNMSRTQDNFAHNMPNIPHPRRSSAAQENRLQVPGERVYGTAKGRDENEGDQYEDLADLSDWERQSHRSGRSAMSQFSQVNALKVKGLETIYLQRLEPAAKGRKTA